MFQPLLTGCYWTRTGGGVDLHHYWGISSNGSRLTPPPRGHPPLIPCDRGCYTLVYLISFQSCFHICEDHPGICCLLSDESDDPFPKHLRHKEALECECSVHSTLDRLLTDRSPKPKKPRNSWRKQKYPEDCKLTSLINGEVTLDDLVENSGFDSQKRRERMRRELMRKKNDRRGIPRSFRDL